MPFEAGEKWNGNEKGRPAGTGYRQKIFNDLVLPYKEALIEKAVTLAMSGDSPMLKLLLERLLPPKPHAHAINLELPEDISKSKSLFLLGELVIRAIAAQDITPSQGKLFLHILEDRQRLLEFEEDEL